jgi:phosphohistidine phosphatase
MTIHHMKNLLIMRHAKSSWEFTNLSDHDRPLNDRGKRDAPRMGKVLLKERLVPQLIISSSAARARSTAEEVAKMSRYNGEISIDSSLYRAGSSAYLNALRRLTNQADTVLIVGHNPDVELLVEILTGNVMTIPTSGLAYVKLSIERWLDLKDDKKGELAKMWRPKELSPGKYST